MSVGRTRVINVLGLSGQELAEALAPAVQELEGGEPVAIPTETVYGLAANALCEKACRRIYEIKHRPADNPLIVHISSLEMLSRLVAPRPAATPSPPADPLDSLLIPPSLKPVLRAFWPGPLTVLLPRKEGGGGGGSGGDGSGDDGKVPDVVTAGLGTVAVRFPAHPVAQKIIELAGFPLAAPSANLSGRPSPTCAAHVLEDLDGRVGVVVDGGSSGFGVESTVLDATREPPMILRPGSITARMLQQYLPTVCIYRKGDGEAGSLSAAEMQQIEERPATPGMKYRHYSPTSPVILFHHLDTGSAGEETAAAVVEQEIARFVQGELDAGHRVARLTIRPSLMTPPWPANYSEFPLSRCGDREEIARNLFAGLRAADAGRPDLIVAQSVGEEDEGLAIMNRLTKAASITRHLGPLSQ